MNALFMSVLQWHGVVNPPINSYQVHFYPWLYIEQNMVWSLEIISDMGKMKMLEICINDLHSRVKTNLIQMSGRNQNANQNIKVWIHYMPIRCLLSDGSWNKFTWVRSKNKQASVNSCPNCRSIERSMGISAKMLLRNDDQGCDVSCYENRVSFLRFELHFTVACDA